MRRSVFIFLICLLTGKAHAVIHPDSLLQRIGDHISRGELEQADRWAVQAFKRNDILTRESRYYRLLDLYAGIVGRQGRSEEAQSVLEEQLRLARKQKRKESDLAVIFTRLGIVNEQQAKYKDALRYYLKALSIDERLKDEIGIAADCNNIGVVYDRLQDTARARASYMRALQIYEKTEDKRAMSNTLANLGILYAEKGQPEKALMYLRRTTALDQESGDVYAIASTHMNLADIFSDMNASDSALFHYRKSAEIRLKIGDTIGMAFTFNRLGQWYLEHGLKQQAKGSFDTALVCAIRSNAQLRMADSYAHLSNYYVSMGDYRAAYDMVFKQMTIKDSVFNDDLHQQLSDLRSQFEIEKRTEEIRNKAQAEKEKLKAVNKEREQRQWLLMAFVIVILITVVVFLMLLYKRFRITQEQKNIIEVQKAEVEGKNREITDSIQYASRIQSSLLPDRDVIKRSLPNAMVIYHPRDVVSGDFYWLIPKGEHILLAVADCTGHGVPGALMSMIGQMLLNEAVKEKSLHDPAAILEYLDEGVRQTLKQHQSDSSKDGMDISLISTHLKTGETYYASANRPVYVYSNREIKSYTGEKRSIGGDLRLDVPFETRALPWKKGDRIYLFTDGVTDQFGGDGGKKLKSSGFKELILHTASLSAGTQEKEVETFFQQWQGDFEQTDDICLVSWEHP